MGYGEVQANYAVGLVYFTSFLMPIFAFIVDYFDRKILWLTVACGILLLGFAFIFLLGSLSILCFCMGIAFAFQGILVPACISRILPNTSFKAGMDCLMTVTMIGVAISMLITGVLLQAFLQHLKDAWVNFLIVETLLATVAAFMCIFALFFDCRISDVNRKPPRETPQPKTPDGTPPAETLFTSNKREAPIAIRSQTRQNTQKAVTGEVNAAYDTANGEEVLKFMKGSGQSKSYDSFSVG